MGKTCVGKKTILIALLLPFASVLACRAETLIDTDFARGASGWVLNGDTHLLEIDGRQVLSLTQNEQSQTGIAWTELKRRVLSFSFIADLRIRFHARLAGDCPADGAALVFAHAETSSQGGAGGSLGLFSGAIDRFSCLEINTWYGQGLGNETERSDCSFGKHVTLAFGVITPEVTASTRSEGYRGTAESGGPKIGQTLPPQGMTIVNGGWYRYQWNVDSTTNTMTAYLTGLEKRNRQFRNVEVLKVRFPRSPIDFEGRFGLTAATGNAVQHTEVAAVRIVSPTIDPS